MNEYDSIQKDYEINILKAQLNDVYNERDRLVALITKFYPSYIARHEESDTSWDDQWRNIIYVETPQGQLSWHIHESELPLFSHLTVKDNNWDGHTKEEKYQRIERLIQAIK